MPKLIARAELAAKLEISESRVQQLVNAKVLPRESGGFDLCACALALLRHLRATKEADGLTDARKKLVAAQTRATEQKTAVASGDLVHLSNLLPIIENALLSVRTTCLGIATAVAQEIAAESDPAVCRAIVQREVEHALTACSELDLAQAVKARRQ
jgi:hypothetical protein